MKLIDRIKHLGLTNQINLSKIDEKDFILDHISCNIYFDYSVFNQKILISEMENILFDQINILKIKDSNKPIQITKEQIKKLEFTHNSFLDLENDGINYFSIEFIDKTNNNKYYITGNNNNLMITKNIMCFIDNYYETDIPISFEIIHSYYNQKLEFKNIIYEKKSLLLYLNYYPTSKNCIDMLTIHLEITLIDDILSFTNFNDIILLLKSRKYFF